VGPAWTCETDKNSLLLTTFTATLNGIEARGLLLPATPGAPEIVEDYTFAAGSERWHAAVASGAFVGDADMWLGNDWTFEGSTVVGSKTFSGRMIFRYLDDNAFRRDFEFKTNGRWRIYSVETCSRGLPQ